MATQHGSVPTKPPKVLIWDIETTNLRATFGTILCIGWKWEEKPKVNIPTILDGGKGMLDDKQLVQDFAEVFNSCDYHVTWYGEKLDQ